MSARDVIDLTLMGRGYDRTEGTSDAILFALRDAGYFVVRVPDKMDWRKTDGIAQGMKAVGWNNCREAMLAEEPAP